jgi:hypothetical protein
MNTATLKDESAPGRELAELTAQARAAYKDKRTKECIDLTNRVLLVDPQNTEANALRDSVQSDIQRDLKDARALLEDSYRMTEGQKYRKAAEIILLKILYLDSGHAEAKQLLADVKGSVGAATQISHGGRIAPLEETVFTANPTPVLKREESSGQGMNLKFPLIFAGIVLLGGGLWFFSSQATGKVTEPAPMPVRTVEDLPPVPRAAPNSASAVSNTVSIVAASSAATQSPTQPLKTAPIAPAAPAPANRVVEPAIPAAPPIASVTTLVPKAGASKESGSLAVNSAIAADIYMGDKYLGATPITLPLAPGRHTLEYRHNDLRAVMTHEIKSRETSTAFVVFETTVQINARPWAMVFVEGASRRALGQTPLSSVRVPIGSRLTFENPNFQAKSHRVTEGDSAIQVVFP